jgi:hypothetical protein
LRMERMGECLWPEEKLGIEEVSRRLLLEHVLWQESKRNMVERMCPSETGYKPRRRADPRAVQALPSPG